VTAEGGINWNGKTVIYQDTLLSMSDFRRLVHMLAEETRAVLLKEPLFVDNSSGRRSFGLAYDNAVW
jgi:hypothetical protein